MYHSPVILLTDWIRNCKADDQLSDETDRANLSFRSISIYFYPILPLTNENFNENANEALTSRKKYFNEGVKKSKRFANKIVFFSFVIQDIYIYILDRFRAKWNPDLDPPPSTLSREANICEEDGDPSQSVDPVFQRLRKLLDERMLIVQLHD